MFYKKLFAAVLTGIFFFSLSAGAQEAAPDVFATINGEAITRSDFYNQIENYQINTQFGSVSVGVKTVEEMINEMLIIQYAKKNETPATESQVQAKIDMIAKQAGGNIGVVLMQSGMTLDQLKQKITVQQSLINTITKGVVVSDDEVKRNYNEAVNAPRSPFKTPDQADVSLIICEDLETIKKAYGELQKGVDFGEVALNYSVDDSAGDTMGHLSWVTVDSPSIPPEIFKAAWRLKPNEYTVTIKAEDKRWYIAKLHEKQESVTTPFDDVKDSLKEQLAVEKASKDDSIFNAFQIFIRDSEVNIDNKYRAVVDKIKQQAAVSIENKSEDAGNTE